MPGTTKLKELATSIKSGYSEGRIDLRGTLDTFLYLASDQVFKNDTLELDVQEDILKPLDIAISYHSNTLYNKDVKERRKHFIKKYFGEIEMLVNGILFRHNINGDTVNLCRNIIYNLDGLKNIIYFENDEL